MNFRLYLTIFTALTFFNGALFSQCPTGTPPTLTCGSTLTVGPNQPSGLYGAVSQSSATCGSSNNMSYSDIYAITYQPGQSLSLDHWYGNVQNANIIIEILDPNQANCPSVSCNELAISGVGQIDATSYVQNTNTGMNNPLVSLNSNLDELGLTPGQTVYIKILTDKKFSGGGTDTSASGAGVYDLTCVTMPENSCENEAPMVGGSTYVVDNQYASDNASALDAEDGSCNYSIENNVMFKWCTDALNTEVDVIFNSITIHEPATGSVQFAILQGNCGGPYTTIQCNSGITAPTTIPINNANTTASTCYWIMMDGNAGTWYTIDMELQDANPVILPVELISFDANIKDDFNSLKWTTSTERNNDYFILERSNDGENWELIHREKGAGNSSSILNYKYKDYTRRDEINYYRLSQVDFDGAKETFRMLAVNNSMDARHVVRVVNLMGQEVELEYKGMKIVYYSDGTTNKVF